MCAPIPSASLVPGAAQPVLHPPAGVRPTWHRADSLPASVVRTGMQGLLWFALAGTAVPSLSRAAEPDLRRRFQTLDTSGNGYLSGSEITPEIRPYDANGDGRIVWEEFAAGGERELAAADEALWRKLDWNPDGWLDGRELEGGWSRFDVDRNGEVTKAEFLAGRARERATAATTAPPPLAPAPTPTPVATPTPARPAEAAPAGAPARPPAPPPAAVAPRRGHIVGRLAAGPGVRLGRVTIRVSGFEDGKLAATTAGGGLAETVMKSVAVTGPVYAVPVPPGAYRVSAYSTHEFNGATYHFPLELEQEPRLDYRGLQLENLRDGLVRNFVLKLTGPRKGEREGPKNYTETTYKHAFHGGRLDFFADQWADGTTRTLRTMFPPESRLLLALQPLALVDGSPGAPLAVDLPLGDDGKWTFNRRGVHPGTYEVSARLRTPDGQERPLRLAATTGLPGATTEWKTSATFTFTPSTLGPTPRMGVNPIRLYLVP